MIGLSYTKEFVWGSATAAYQIEGAWNSTGKGLSNWDHFCDIPGTINNGDTGKVADDFYHKFEDDIKYMQDLGLKHFRMSLSWPRLLPKGHANTIN